MPVARHGRAAAARRFPASARISPRRSASWPRPAPAPYHQELLAGVPADDPRPAAPAGRRAEDGGAALLDAEHLARSTTWPPRRATGRLRALKGMGAKKEAQILKAIEERAEGRRPAPAGRHGGHGRRARRLPARATRRTSSSFRSAACGAAARPAATSTSSRSAATPTLMDVVRRAPAGRARARPGRHEVERAAARRLPGRPAPGAAREPRRGDAVLHRLQGAQHRRCATARSSAASS